MFLPPQVGVARPETTVILRKELLPVSLRAEQTRERGSTFTHTGPQRSPGLLLAPAYAWTPGACGLHVGHKPQPPLLTLNKRRNIKGKEKNTDQNGCVCFFHFNHIGLRKSNYGKQQGNELFLLLFPRFAETRPPHTGTGAPHGGTEAAGIRVVWALA